jgi:hypothetical protein
VASLCLLSASPWSWAAADAAIEGAARVPLIPGLMLDGAASERQGDYESVLTVEAIDAAGTVHLTIAAQLPDPAGGNARAVTCGTRAKSARRTHSSMTAAPLAF